MDSQNRTFFEVTAKVLIRCVIGGLILLMIWFVAFTFMDDFIYEIHSKWFDITRQQFDVIHYAGIAWMKMMLLVFFLIPYICLRIVLAKHKEK